MADEVTKTIAADEDIWDPDDAERGQFLTLDEQRGVIELELTVPLKLSDRDETLTHLKVTYPSGPDIDAIARGSGNDNKLVAKCVQGVNPKDLENLPHGRDNMRLKRLIRHFLR